MRSIGSVFLVIASSTRVRIHPAAFVNSRFEKNPMEPQGRVTVSGHGHVQDSSESPVHSEIPRL